MKKNNFVFKVFTIFSLFLFSFSIAQDKKIDVEKSTVNWKGHKIVGGHEGTIKVKSGWLKFKNNKLSGGSVEIDMNTISSTDVDGDSKTSLDGHLKDDDFFGVKKHPIAKMLFKKIKSLGNDKYLVTADLTIKGIKKSVSFNIVAKTSGATGSLEIDRTKFNIKYNSGSGFGDKMIKDNFDISFDLKF